LNHVAGCQFERLQERTFIRAIGHDDNGPARVVVSINEILIKLGVGATPCATLSDDDQDRRCGPTEVDACQPHRRAFCWTLGPNRSCFCGRGRSQDITRQRSPANMTIASALAQSHSSRAKRNGVSLIIGRSIAARARCLWCARPGPKAESQVVRPTRNSSSLRHRSSRSDRRIPIAAPIAIDPGTRHRSRSLACPAPLGNLVGGSSFPPAVSAERSGPRHFACHVTHA
jgi:hypothetical protein